MFFFPFVSTIKVNHAKCLLICYFTWKAQKNTTCHRRGFKKIKGFKTSFRKTATYQKLWGEVPSTTRFPLLKYTTVGRMNLRVRPRVDMFLKSNSLSGTHAPYSLLNSSNKVLLAKRFRKMEYRTRLLETVEDFFVNVTSMILIFKLIERVFCWSFQSPEYVYF